MRLLLIVCALVAPLVAHAQFGWFGGGEPPDEFMSTQLSTNFLSGTPDLDLTVRELVDGLSMSADGECETEWDNGDGLYTLICPIPFGMATVSAVFLLVWVRDRDVSMMRMYFGQSQLPFHEIDAWLDILVREESRR